MNLNTGTLLANGRYKILSLLGQGGFGITYLGEQVGLGRKVAIKEFFMKEYCERNNDTSQITLGSSGSRELVERFRIKFIKEARNIALFKNPHIVTIIDIFEENGTAYYVMEYIEGGTLSSLLKKRGVLGESDAVNYTHQVADALAYIHSYRIMHLDVKPANIMLDDKDNAILIDFGLAKQYDDVGLQTSTTPVGISHGFAPLEQYKNGGVSQFSPATDIYSLGATLYKLVTGNTPPDASDINDDGLPSLPGHLSASTRAAIEAAMQPRRKERPQSIAEFLAILDGSNPIIENDDKTIVPETKNDSEETVVIDSVKETVTPVEKKSERKDADIPHANVVNETDKSEKHVNLINKTETKENAVSQNKKKTSGITFIRVVLAIVFPPLAVLDRGLASILIVLILTVLGWVAGIIAALVILYNSRE